MKLLRSFSVLIISICVSGANADSVATPKEFRVLEVAGDVRLDDKPAFFNATILPTTTVSLAPSAQLVAYSDALKLRIVGPNNGLFETFVGSIDQPSSLLSRLMLVFQRAAAILPSRGSSMSSKDVWVAQMETGGNKCAPSDGILSISLPRGTHDSYLSVRAIAAGVPEVIPTKSRTQVAWPNAIPLVDGSEYELELDGHNGPVRWRTYRMPKEPPPTDESTEVFLAEHECLEQLVAFARALPDDKVIQPATK
jgi:hypothetical protein